MSKYTLCFCKQYVLHIKCLNQSILLFPQIYIYIFFFFYLKCFDQSDVNYSQLNKFADPTDNSSSKHLF